MPRKDGTGPEGKGVVTGQGRGGCKAGNTRRGSGRDRGRGGRRVGGQKQGRQRKNQ